MKSTKTVLAVALLIAGFAYAANAFPPGGNQNRDCSFPKPEDFRAYDVVLEAVGPTIIVPIVEGTNGFVLTDIVLEQPGSIDILQDAGDGPVVIMSTSIHTDLLHTSLTTGIPVAVGSTILANSDASSILVTIRGYVY